MLRFVAMAVHPAILGRVSALTPEVPAPGFRRNDPFVQWINQ